MTIVSSQAKGALEVSAYSHAGELLEKGQLTLINNQVTTRHRHGHAAGHVRQSGRGALAGRIRSVQLVIGIRRNVVTVPASAVMVGPNGDYVYVIGARRQGHAGRRPAKTRDAAAFRSSAKAFPPGQKVVATGQYRLR